MTTFIEVTIGGILLGAVYGLGACGMALIFGVMRMLNLSHGAFMVAGGAISWGMGHHSGLGLLFSVPVVMAAALAGGGLLAAWGLVPAETPDGTESELQDLSGHLLVTLGCALIIEDLVIRWSPQGVFALPLESPLIAVAGIDISLFKLLLLVMALGLFALFSVILKKTDFGRMIRACTQERTGAVLMGVPYRNLSVAVFAAGSAMAGLAGSFYLMLYPVRAHMAIPLTIKALLVVVLGGMGRIFHAFIAALFLGLAEVYTGFWASTETQMMVPYVGMVAILLMWPEGIGSIRKKP